MKASQIPALRLANQHLIGPGFGSPADVVKWFCALQSQDYGGATWAIDQRLTGRSRETVDGLFERGEILRTHVMRPTWHFVLREDIRWLLDLTGARVQASSASRYRELGLDPATLRRAARILTKALASDVYLTRVQMGERLVRAGVSPNGQRLPYILVYAELQGLICSGPLRGMQHTFALLDDRAPAAMEKSREEALAELALRYLAGHGPALARDFAWWSGLTVRDARLGIELAGDGIVADQIDGYPYFSAAASDDLPRLRKPTVHLLPNFDEYLVGYRDYSPIFDQARLGVARLTPAFARHIVLLDGQMIGGWRRAVTKQGVEMTTELFVDLAAKEWKALERAAEAYARSIDHELVSLT